MSDLSLPLDPDLVDELLSAELDGEFDAAARDLGMEPADARARLDAMPAVAARRVALARARDVLAELPPVDELLAARLRAKAAKAAGQVDESRRVERARRWQRALAVSGAVAAGVAIVVGVAVSVTRSSDQQGKASSSAAAPAPTAAEAPLSDTSAPAGAPGADQAVDLGEFPDVATLAKHVETVASSPTSESRSPSNYGTSQEQTKGAYDTTFVKCDAVVRQFGGVESAPVLRAVATLAGTRVAVQVFQKSTERVLVVVTADCRLVNQRVLVAPSG